MIDKFMFYSTLKVSLSPGINSIWRSCFFRKRNWKHFWMKTWKHFFLLNIFICQVLDSSLSMSRLLSWTQLQNSNCLLYFDCSVFTNVPGCCSRISKEGTSRSTTRGYPMDPSRLGSTLKTSQQLPLWHERSELLPISTFPKHLFT